TIDFAGPNGMSIYHATQIRYEYALAKGLKAGIGVEMPIVDGLTNEHVSIAKQRMPNFPIYMQYGWTPKSHFRAAAIIRSMSYDNLTAHKTESEIGWGVLASATFNVMNRLQVYGQGVYGKGIGQFLNDMSLLNVDVVPNPEKEGKMQVLPMMGWFAGMQYNFSPKVFITSTYGQSRLYSHDGYPTTPSEQYRYGQYLNATLFWNITSDLQVGAEYLRGWRTDFNGDTRHANRMNLAVQYSF
ncbi:porin, partial [Parabacteroides johnsonii]